MMYFADVRDALADAGVESEHERSLVRGLDYYCHTAFEFITDELGAQGTVLGGGRYDGLSEMLGGPQVAGVGWAAGIERLAMLVDAVDAPVSHIAVMPFEEEQGPFAIHVAESLRNLELAVEMSMEGAIGKRLKKADKAGIRYAAIIGSDEVDKKLVQLRDLTSGEQTQVAIDELAIRIDPSIKTKASKQ